MPEPLYDLRAKVTPETMCALAAVARSQDADKSEIVRDILHKWAMRQIHGATVLARCLRAKGLAAAAEGISAAAQGKPGNDGEALDWSDE